MAAAIGVTSLHGLTAPSVGAVQLSSSGLSIGYEKERGADGNSKFLVAHKFTREEVRISGVGSAALATALAAAGTKAKGAVGIIRAKQEEFQSRLPRFEITGVVLDDAA